MIVSFHLIDKYYQFIFLLYFGMNFSFCVVNFTIFVHSLLAESLNTIRCWGSLHKNNTSSLLLGLNHASGNWISIVKCK